MLPDALKRRLVIPFLNRRYEADRRKYWETRECGERMRLAYEGDPDTEMSGWAFMDGVKGLAPQPKSILEVGCGYGRLLKMLWDGGHRNLFGVDMSIASLTAARSYLKSPEVTLSVADVTDGLPFVDKSIGLVFTSGVLMHIPPKLFPKAVGECLRVARTWVMHCEDVRKGYPKYGHDVKAHYESLGYSPVTLDMPVPYLQFMTVRVGEEAKA